MRLPTCVGLLLFILMSVNGPSDVTAHAILLRAIPPSTQSLTAPPGQVRLLFSEPLDPVFSGVRVVNASNQPVDGGDGRVDPNDDRQLVASLPPGLPNGVYTVIWRSFSQIDVHPDEGRYPLYVGVPVATDAAQATVSGQNTSTPETILARWWFYVSASLFAGVLFGWKFFLSRALAGAPQETREAVQRRVHRIVMLGGALFVVGTMYAALAQAAAAVNVPVWNAAGQPVVDLLGRGRFASIWWPRLGLEVAALVLIGFGGLEGTLSDVALAMLPAVLLTASLTSHGASVPPSGALGVGVDWLHVLSATAWVGGLFCMLIAVPWLLRQRMTGMVTPLVIAFGRYAMLAVAAVALSGTAQAAIEVGSFDGLFGTAYGLLVLVKIGLLLAMLIVAGINRRSGSRTRAGSVARSGNALLGRAVGVELMLGVVVLAVAAVLSGTPPARGAAPSSQPVSAIRSDR